VGAQTQVRVAADYLRRGVGRDTDDDRGEEYRLHEAPQERALHALHTPSHEFVTAAHAQGSVLRADEASTRSISVSAATDEGRRT
jgi:hypothetical protein